MAQTVIAMESKLLAVLSSGLPLPVSRLCRELGISRQTFYKYRRRWAAEGPAGLVERSRRPHRSPGQVGVDLEAEIVRLRKVLPLDNGAQTIAYHLARSGWVVPSVATIHRVLVRRGQVVPQPESARGLRGGDLSGRHRMRVGRSTPRGGCSLMDARYGSWMSSMITPAC
jgi:transposase-like protein